MKATLDMRGYVNKVIKSISYVEDQLLDSVVSKAPNFEEPKLQRLLNILYAEKLDAKSIPLSLVIFVCENNRDFNGKHRLSDSLSLVRKKAIYKCLDEIIYHSNGNEDIKQSLNDFYKNWSSFVSQNKGFMNKSITRISSNTRSGGRCHKVTLYNPRTSFEATIDCPDDMTILDAAEERGINLPYSSRVGAEPSSLALLISGTVDQSTQTFLTEDEVSQGLILLDVAYPTSRCVIRTHYEEFYYITINDVIVTNPNSSPPHVFPPYIVGGSGEDDKSNENPGGGGAGAGSSDSGVKDSEQPDTIRKPNKNLMDKAKFVGLKEYSNCNTACIAILKKHGITNPGSSNNVFKLMYETGEPRKLIKYGSNPAQNYKNAIDCIDRHLDANRPIMVGVDHTSRYIPQGSTRTEPINEGATDHFIVINGRGYDSNTGMYYYTYYEVGTNSIDKGCNNSDNRLMYNPITCELYDNVAGSRNNKKFNVTQVRPNDGNTMGTINQNSN